MLKIAVLAPTPSVSVSTAVTVNPGDLRSPRRAKPTSCQKLVMLWVASPHSVTEQSPCPPFGPSGRLFQELTRRIRSTPSAFDTTLCGNGHDFETVLGRVAGNRLAVGFQSLDNAA